MREVVPIGLDAHAVDDGLAKGEVIPAATQDGQQIGSIVLTKARIEFPLGGNPYPVAGIAEIVTMRRNEADPRFAARDAPITRWSARALGRGNQFEMLRQNIPSFLGRNVGIASTENLAKRHFFNEGNIEFVVDGKADQVYEFVIVGTPHHDRSEERRVGKECRSRWSPY